MWHLSSAQRRSLQVIVLSLRSSASWKSDLIKLAKERRSQHEKWVPAYESYHPVCCDANTLSTSTQHQISTLVKKQNKNGSQTDVFSPRLPDQTRQCGFLGFSQIVHCNDSLLHFQWFFFPISALVNRSFAETKNICDLAELSARDG